MSDTKRKKYFVYVDYTMEDVPRPYYVGKGNTNRLLQIKRNKVHTGLMKKYGFDRRVVFETFDEDEAFQNEISLIQEYKTHAFSEGHWGANLTLGGEGGAGRVISKEERKARSESMKKSLQKKPRTPEHTKKIADANRGKKHKPDSVETRKRKSEALKKYCAEHPRTDEHQKKITDKTRGKKQKPDSLETRKRKSIALKKHYSKHHRTREHQQKINAKLKGKMSDVQRGKKHPHRGTPFSEEAKIHMKAIWQDPIIAEKRRIAMRLGWEKRRQRLAKEKEDE